MARSIPQAFLYAVPLTIFAHVATCLFFALGLALAGFVKEGISGLFVGLLVYPTIHILLTGLLLFHLVIIPYIFITMHIYTVLIFYQKKRFYFHPINLISGIVFGLAYAICLGVSGKYNSNLSEIPSHPFNTICASVGFANALVITWFYERNRNKPQHTQLVTT